MSEFRNPAVKQLTDQQVRYAPPAKRREQLARAVQLLGDVDSAKRYPYQFVCFRITGFRTDAYPDLVVDGADLRHDLRLLIDRLDRSLPPVPIEQAAEPMLTLEQVSRQLNVSTKTFRRWKDAHNLVGWRVLHNGRRHLGFPKTAVERFIAEHRARVARGSRFSHLTDAEKDEIVRSAQRLAREGRSLTQVSRAIARRLGRSAEAVRYTIKNFDRAHPSAAVFPGVAGPLDRPAKQLIFHSYRRGIPVNTLAKRFNRTRTSMYRVISEVRAEQLAKQASDYIYHPSFDDRAQEEAILAPMPDAEAFEEAKGNLRVPKDVPPELAPLYEMPLLNKPQEQHLFRQMNFLKHQLKRVVAKFQRPDGTVDAAKVKIEDLEAIERLQEQVQKVKEMLIACNMRLVDAILPVDAVDRSGPPGRRTEIPQRGG